MLPSRTTVGIVLWRHHRQSAHSPRILCLYGLRRRNGGSSRSVRRGLLSQMTRSQMRILPLALRAAAQNGVGPSALEVFVEGHVALDTHLVSGDRTFEEVGQFLHVLEFHERERVLRPVLLAEA